MFIGMLGEVYATYHSITKAIRRATRYDIFYFALNSTRENWTLRPSITICPWNWLLTEKEPHKPVERIRQPCRPRSDACLPVQLAPSHLPKKNSNSIRYRNPSSPPPCSDASAFRSHPADRMPRSTSPQQIPTFIQISRPVYPSKRPRIKTPLQNRK